MFSCLWMSLLSEPLCGQRWEACMCNSHVHPPVSPFLSVPVENHGFTPMPLILVQRHRAHPSLVPLHICTFVCQRGEDCFRYSLSVFLIAQSPCMWPVSGPAGLPSLSLPRPMPGRRAAFRKGGRPQTLLADLSPSSHPSRSLSERTGFLPISLSPPPAPVPRMWWTLRSVKLNNNCLPHRERAFSFPDHFYVCGSHPGLLGRQGKSSVFRGKC